VKLRLDVSDLHAVLALVCGGASVMFTAGCLVGAINDRGKVMPMAIAAMIAVAMWCALFALVLRGTVFTRVAAALGLVGAGLAVGVGSCAAAIH
jgi:hypothetical protein